MVCIATTGVLAARRAGGNVPGSRVRSQSVDRNVGCRRSVRVSKRDVITAERADLSPICDR